ncbi:uncharacterized protein LOC135490945 [Lineus longissimus]|uniref:uncharacterized protein LOC135490945 n=1 Tax=Lineus longissimus TaxID=88925 RepID=UPI00315D1749
MIFSEWRLVFQTFTGIHSDIHVDDRFTHSLIYHTAFMLIFTEPGDIYQNVLSAATSTFLALASTYPLTGKFGRKKAFVIFMIVPMSALVAEIVFYGLGLRLRNVTMGVIILAGAYYRALDLLVGKYTNEIFPGPLRNHAVRLGCVSARFAAVLAPVAAYLGNIRIWVYPFIICFVFAVISAVLIMASWPETGKKVLLDLPPPPIAKGHKSSENLHDKAHHVGNGMEKDRLEYSEMKERNGDADDIALEMDDAYLKTKDA